jgi:hypothetical protein
MTLDEAIEIAKNYYKDKEMPSIVKEWGRNCPPELTENKIYRNCNFTIGDLLWEINPNKRLRRRKPRAPVTLGYELNSLGILELNWETRVKCNYKCGKCGKWSSTTRETLDKWYKSNIKYCSTCRGASGVPKSTEYYQQFLPDDFKCMRVLPEPGNTKIEVIHKPCSNIKVYSSRHVLDPERDYLVCNFCDNRDGFDSVVEKEVVQHLKSTFPDIEILLQVKYSDLVKTDRRWVLDLYIPSINLALEITTKSNNFEGYFDNLTEKLSILTNNSFIAKVAYSKEMAEDIVRSLLKDRE